MVPAEPLKKKRLLHPANIVLALIVVAFVAWEIVAAFFDKGRLVVMVTLSEYVWYARNIPWLWWPMLALITGFCAWLWVHFVFQGPR